MVSFSLCLPHLNQCIEIFHPFRINDTVYTVLNMLIIIRWRSIYGVFKRNVNNFTYSIKYVIYMRTRKSFIPEERKKTNIQQIWIYSKITEPLVRYEYLVYYKIYKDVEVIFFDTVYSTVNGMTIDLISSSLSLHQSLNRMMPQSWVTWNAFNRMVGANRF